MKALVLRKYGSLDHLHVTELPRPTLKPGEILVKVHAVGLNPIDLMIPKGMFKPILKFELPAVMGSDLAGIVVEAGSAVTRFKVGDAVFASIFDTGNGSLAEYTVVPEALAARKPDNIDFIEAASVPMVGLTAWQAFHERAKIMPGHKVFVPAGAGGIGSFAIQLAKHMGAVVGTTTSTGNVDLVRQLGADEIVDYKQQRFDAVLHGYQTVLGTLRGDELDNAFNIVAPGSQVISLVGPPDAAFARKRGMHFIMPLVFRLLSSKIRRRARRHQADYSFLFMRPDGAQLAQLADLLASAAIKPVIDRVFSFGEVRQALDYLALGRARGKVVVHLV